MSQHSIRRLPLAGLAVLLVLALLGTVASSSVVVRNPLPKSLLSGTVQVSADVVNVSDFSYSVLTIDGAASGVSNALPIEFTVDTTQYSNGAHTFEIDLYNVGGVVSKSDAIPVFIMNGGGPTVTPLPGPTVSGEMMGHPVPPALGTSGQAAIPPPSGGQTGVTDGGPAGMASGGQGGAQTTMSVLPDPDAPAAPPVIAGVPVLLQGQPLNFPVPPYEDNGRTMVMLRTLALYAGGTVDWKYPYVTVNMDSFRIIFKVDDTFVLTNGFPSHMDRAAVVKQDRTFVPVVIWRTLLGGKVNYDASTHSVLLDERPYSCDDNPPSAPGRAKE